MSGGFATSRALFVVEGRLVSLADGTTVNGPLTVGARVFVTGTPNGGTVQAGTIEVSGAGVRELLSRKTVEGILVRIVAPLNIPSSMPTDASTLWSRNVTNFLLAFWKDKAFTLEIDERCFELGLIVRPLGDLCVVSPPLVITTNCATVMIRKTTRPTAMSPPITKLPNAVTMSSSSLFAGPR